MDVRGPFRDAWPPGWHVEHVAETASTNADLIERGVSAPARTVLFADHQTAGRGRLDRRWDAPPGTNLLVSLLFQGGSPIELMRRVAIAAVTAVAPSRIGAAGVDARLKWPNDILVEDRKLAGMLAQRAGDTIVIGLGVNVGWAPEGAARLGDGVTPAGVLTHLLAAFDELATQSSEAVHARYRELLSTLGQQVRVELAGGELVGRAIDVQPSGELVVLDECAVSHRIDVGDVVHVRPAR